MEEVKKVLTQYKNKFPTEINYSLIELKFERFKFNNKIEKQVFLYLSKILRKNSFVCTEIPSLNKFIDDTLLAKFNYNNYFNDLYTGNIKNITDLLKKYENNLIANSIPFLIKMACGFSLQIIDSEKIEKIYFQFIEKFLNETK